MNKTTTKQAIKWLKKQPPSTERDKVLEIIQASDRFGETVNNPHLVFVSMSPKQWRKYVEFLNLD